MLLSVLKLTGTFSEEDGEEGEGLPLFLCLWFPLHPILISL